MPKRWPLRSRPWPTSQIARWRLGGHDASDFSTRPTRWWSIRRCGPIIRCSQSPGPAGRTITSEIELFLDECPATVVGVTGSNGKSSTATMLAAMLRAGGRRTWLGGNIGNSLLPVLGAIRTGRRRGAGAEQFPARPFEHQARFPSAAVVTNCTPNHLDWHGTFAAYVAAKRRLVETSAGRRAGRAQPGRSRVVVVAGAGSGQSARCPGRSSESLGWRLPATSADERGPGRGDGRSTGGRAGAIGQALADFRGLPHRQESAGLVAGRHFVDDSKSTTPEATLAALAACDGPVWVLVGGQDKGCRSNRFAGVGRACRGSGLLRCVWARRLAKRCRRSAPPPRWRSSTAWTKRLTGAGIVRGRATRSCFRPPRPVSISSAILSTGPKCFAPGSPSTAL